MTEYIVLSFSLTFIAIQIAELLKCMLSHTGDLGSRLDTLDDIDTEKKLSISPNCFIALKFISLVQLMLENGMRTGVRQCLQVSERDREGSEVKWVMAG